MEASDAPIFSAVSNYTHQLCTILRCIGFASKAAVHITQHGIRFSAEDGRVMQGLAFLDRALFTNYVFNPASNPNGTAANADDTEDDSLSPSRYPRFMISLTALIETLQIFGLNDPSQTSKPVPNTMSGSASHAFSAPALFLNRTCTISYVAPGSPLCITLTEAGVTTTCELTTYEPDDLIFDSLEDADIPLQRDAIVFKIVMRSLWLHNAIMELDSTNPTVLTLSASPKEEPYFALSASGGPFGESTVEFSVDKELDGSADPAYKSFNEDGSSKQPKRHKLAPSVAETFLVHPPSSKSSVRQRYRFALIRKAVRAMAVSSKVSVRGDRQGVLSMQFMIELSDSSSSSDGPTRQLQTSGRNMPENVNFVDFRFVPLVDEEEDDDEVS
ncbi:checkpoint clamp complex protein Rad1 [Emydomyces testavorans]|uniref:Checkpoint clamp complex protein Rad1 n=1 Tax=Emydomyces testavorans TaxID=2070801 RepID=A0AAF0DFL6_9EURO|nr:checkpoint clamp complex protein Rad1 [Emydomyces testavorans]